MKNQEFENICHAVESGEEKQVEHQVTHRTGKVMGCRGRNFEVEVEGEHKSWDKVNCEKTAEKGSSRNYTI